MAETDKSESSGRSGSTRRQFLFGGAAAGLGAAAALGIDHTVAGFRDQRDTAQAPLNGSETVAFYGAHQAGVETDPQAHTTFVGLDLRDDVDRDALARMMKVLSADAARITQGEAPLADSEPELALWPARLTITFGFGPEFVSRAQGQAPAWLKPLPAFHIDRLTPEFCDGDLMIQIGSDDPVTVSHAARMILKDARGFAKIRWVQSGFRNARDTAKPGTTMRNLLGQVDGTSNPARGSQDFQDVVWNSTGWLTGGTGMVIRRIAMNLDKWDELDRSGRDQVVGRYQSNGAPLTSSPHGAAAEFDEPDFEATDANGFTVIPDFSHMARARQHEKKDRIFRRAYNYESAPTGNRLSDAGLLFVSYQGDVDKQFVPIQRRLDKLDLLNEWTTPIGSAVFAIPPGCKKGGFIGDTLLS
jgi:dye decolorizing peroxidase